MWGYYVDPASGGLGKIRGTGASVPRDLINVPIGFDIQLLGIDGYNDVFRSYGDFSVGRDGKGNITCLGEGGPYIYNTFCYGYNGTTTDYTDLSESHPIQLPALSANSALYFGDTDEYDFFGIEYTLDQFYIEGGGSNLVFEYWNGAAWTSFHIMDTRFGYSDSNNSNAFQIGLYRHRVSFDQSIKTDWVTTTVNGTDAKWIRIRVNGGAATQTMQINGISTNRFKLDGSFTEIRANGTRVYHGNARGLRLRDISFKRGTSASSQSVDISTNIPAFLLTDNEFENARDDEIYFLFDVTEDVDTSCGLTVSIEGYGDQNSAGATQLVFPIYVAGVPDEGSYIGNNTEETGSITVDMTGYTSPARVSSISSLFDIQTLNVRNVVYGRIRRLGATSPDTYDSVVGGHFVMTHLRAGYYSWQDGILNA